MSLAYNTKIIFHLSLVKLLHVSYVLRFVSYGTPT
nr:MAG TPA: hypothetical protein [Crassvirales sp.]